MYIEVLGYGTLFLVVGLIVFELIQILRKRKWGENR